MKTIDAIKSSKLTSEEIAEMNEYIDKHVIGLISHLEELENIFVELKGFTGDIRLRRDVYGAWGIQIGDLIFEPETGNSITNEKQQEERWYRFQTVFTELNH